MQFPPDSHAVPLASQVHFRYIRAWKAIKTNNKPRIPQKMRNSIPATLLMAVVALSLSRVTWAQHATAFDVVDGKQAYQQFCANCHGPDGDLIANVDLGHGNFRQPYTDEQLAAIISGGIPNTPMPGNPTMAEAQILQIVAYLRSLATDQTYTLAGDPARGRQLFEGKGNCISCHRVNGQGSGLGPDLSAVGKTRTGVELMESLLDPQVQVQANSRRYRVRTRSGEAVEGRLLNRGAFSVQLLDTSERLRSFEFAELQEYGFAESNMPSLRGQFDEQEIADIVEYLRSL
jgi:putative heme-binding domain-containing protein